MDNSSNNNGQAVIATQLRRVIIEDADGYKHCYLVPDNISDADASQGILSDPPDLELWDWDAIRRELHNKLVERGYFTYRDIVNIEGFKPIITTVFTNRLVETYKLRELD